MTDESEKADIVDRLRMAARVGDVPFYYDDAGKMVFHDDTMSEAADLITSLRKQLEEARADKRMVEDLLTAAVDDYNDAIGEIKARSDAYERVCRERDEAKATALEEAALYIEQVNGSIPDRQEHAAAIRNLAGDQP